MENDSRLLVAAAGRVRATFAALAPCKHRVRASSTMRSAALYSSTGSARSATVPMKTRPSERTHLSPLGWEHINLTGDYHWETSPTLGPDQFRPLRTRSHDLAAADLACLRFRFVASPLIEAPAKLNVILFWRHGTALFRDAPDCASVRRVRLEDQPRGCDGGEGRADMASGLGLVEYRFADSGVVVLCAPAHIYARIWKTLQECSCSRLRPHRSTSGEPSCSLSPVLPERPFRLQEMPVDY